MIFRRFDKNDCKLFKFILGTFLFTRIFIHWLVLYYIVPVDEWWNENIYLQLDQIKRIICLNVNKYILFLHNLT